MCSCCAWFTKATKLLSSRKQLHHVHKLGEMSHTVMTLALYSSFVSLKFDHCACLFEFNETGRDSK